MKTFAPKLAIVLFSLVVPALAGGWTCAGRNFEGDEVRAQAEHWAREGIDKVSDFVNDEGGQLYYFEVGRETQLTECRCTSMVSDSHNTDLLCVKKHAQGAALTRISPERYTILGFWITTTVNGNCAPLIKKTVKAVTVRLLKYIILWKQG
ncbi:putative secreted effector protein [Blumeria graminis f. sp. tritici 96224]|nr:putative secreted effector protein [Blumeria graminis f. sp. tritici 96224]